MTRRLAEGKTHTDEDDGRKEQLFQEENNVLVWLVSHMNVIPQNS